MSETLAAKGVESAESRGGSEGASYPWIAEGLASLAVPVDALNLDGANVRTHDEKNLAAIRASLTRFGQRQPIVVQRQGMIVRAGNGRLRVAKELGWTHMAALIVDEGDVEATAYAIADNRSAELAEWDDAALHAMLESLPDGLAEEIGFDAKDMSELEKSIGSDDVVEDEPPEPPEDPVTQPGDLWVMGGHRLLCGDSTKPDDVGRLLNGEQACAVITDPPYGVDYVGKTKDALVVKNDGRETLLPLLNESLRIASDNCLPGGVWYVAAPAGPQFYDFATVLNALEIWRQTLVWAKQSLVMGHSDYHYQHEAIFYGWKPGANHKRPPDRKQTTLWHFDRPTASREHPTMKPVGLYAKMLDNSTSVGSLVYEPFGGSGTTLIASEQLGRKCYGMEISPQYCDVIVKRWQTLTGKQAVLDGGGTFEETAQAMGKTV